MCAADRQVLRLRHGGGDGARGAAGGQGAGFTWHRFMSLLLESLHRPAGVLEHDADVFLPLRWRAAPRTMASASSSSWAAPPASSPCRRPWRRVRPQHASTPNPNPSPNPSPNPARMLNLMVPSKTRLQRPAARLGLAGQTVFLLQAPSLLCGAAERRGLHIALERHRHWFAEGNRS